VVPDILTVLLGSAYMMSFGSPEDKLLGGIISPRLLNGAIGTKAVARVDFRVPAETNDFGVSVDAEIPFNKMSGGEVANMNDGSIVSVGTGLTPRPRGAGVDTIRNVAYFLRTVAQGSVFWETWLNDYEHFFRVSAGVSYQEFARGAFGYQDKNLAWHPITNVTPSDTTATGIAYIGLAHPTEVEDWIFAKVEYLNQSGFPFGVSAQLANRNLLLSGFIPVIPNWLFIEAKYSTPILRDTPAPWEQSSFFMISPILRFKIDQ
jgi:hypothetical protein